MTGSGDALVQIDRAEPAGEARATETVVRPQPVHTLGAVLTAVVLTIINVLLTKLPLKNKTFKKSKLLKRKSHVLTLISISTLAVIRSQPLSVHWGDIIAGGIVLTPVILTFIYVKLNTRKVQSRYQTEGPSF